METSQGEAAQCPIASTQSYTWRHGRTSCGVSGDSGRKQNVVNKIIDIQKLGTEDKAHVFAMLDAFVQSHKAKKVFAS